MTTKLQVVRVEFSFVLVDEGDEDVDEKARDCIADVVQCMSIYNFDVSVTDYKPGILYGWNDGSIPYGGDGDKQIKDYAEEQK